MKGARSENGGRSMTASASAAVLILATAVVGVLATYGDAPVSFLVAKKEVKQLLGLSADIYYLREGVKNDYALNFTVIIPADVTSLHFTWENLSEKPVVYEITMDYKNRAAMEEPRMNITDHGKLPKGRTVFRVDFPCTGVENAEVEIIMGVNVTTAYYMSSLRLKRKKICLKNLVELQQPPEKKDPLLLPAPIPPQRGEDPLGNENNKAKHHLTPKNNHQQNVVNGILPDHLDSSSSSSGGSLFHRKAEDESSSPSVASPKAHNNVKMTGPGGAGDRGSSSAAAAAAAVPEGHGIPRRDSSAVLGSEAGGILAPPAPIFVTVIAAIGGTVFVILLIGGGAYLIARKNKQRRGHGRGGSDHDMKYESVDMIFCRPDDASTLKRGGSYATIASAPSSNQHGGQNGGGGGGGGGTAVTLLAMTTTTTTSAATATTNGHGINGNGNNVNNNGHSLKPLPRIPMATAGNNTFNGSGSVSASAVGYNIVGNAAAGNGHNNNVSKNDVSEHEMLLYPNGNTSISGGSSSHNTTATASSSDKGTLFGIAASDGGGGSHVALLGGNTTTTVGRAPGAAGGGQGSKHNMKMWGTGGSSFSLGGNGGPGVASGAQHQQHMRSKPPFTPKLGGSGRRINGGSRTPIQQMSHPRITLPPPPPETPPPPAPTYATPIYTPPTSSASPAPLRQTMLPSSLGGLNGHHADSGMQNNNQQEQHHHYHHPHHSPPSPQGQQQHGHHPHHPQATVTEMIKELCMDQSRLRYTELVQEGTYGRVYRGLYTSPTAGKGQEVLIKTVTNESSSVQRTLLLGEGLLMFGLSHPNILTIIGVSVEDRLSLVYPFVNGGNLKLFLNSCQVGPEGATRSFPLLTQEVVRMATQVAQACAYLGDKDVVHRDLATRNCVLDEKLRLKVADNALSRDLFPGDYECIGDGDNRPLRWMAPEAIVDKEFSQASDVWAYGVFLWELTTLAQQPYHEVDPFEMVEFLYEGYRLLQPVHCPDELFDLMTSCWDTDPKNRPTFRQILDYLRDFRSSLEKYI